MKKICSIICLLAVCVSLVACTVTDTKDPAIDKQSSTNQEASKENSSKEESKPESQAAKSDYVVTIDGIKTAVDYEDKPCVVVDYTFTNNGEDDANFMFAVSCKAFQNGIELSTAIIMDDEIYNSENSLKDIKPGATIKVQGAYKTEDLSKVLIEIEELISLDDTLLASKEFDIA